MIPTKLFTLGLLATLGFSSLSGCASAPDGDDDSTTEAGYAMSIRPADLVEQFPTPADLTAALDAYGRNRDKARAAAPMAIGEFFGGARTSANIDSLSVEQLKAPSAPAARPMAFLSACFRGGDMYWNDRNKDVQLYRLFDGVGLKNVFPESHYYGDIGCSLIRIWGSYRPVGKGRPPGMDDATLRRELAKVAIVSYVAGNVDGPSHNGNNAGFTRVRDPKTGAESWSAVVIDNGASWNWPSDDQKPWRTNLAGTGPVARENIPAEVTAALTRIAESTRGKLAEISGFVPADDSAKAIMENERTRAREVLDHYGIEYRALP